jgi:hypothetical protein
MSHRIFLDDERMPAQVTWVDMPLGPWTILRSYNEFVSFIKRNGIPEFITFDHDLSWEHYEPEIDPSKYDEKTGFDCAKWLVEKCLNENIDFPEYQVHSKNTVGKENIISYIESFKRSRSQ